MFRRSRHAVLVAATIVALTVPLFIASSAMAWNPGEGFSASGFTAEALSEEGGLDTQAGGHPYSATTEFGFSGGDVRDIDVDLPPGFLGNPQATPQCPVAQLTALEDHPCAIDTIVGVVNLKTPDGRSAGQNIPVYNLVPEPGFPSEFGFVIQGVHPVILYGTVRTGGDYGITVVTPGIVQAVELGHVAFTFFGVPAERNGSKETPQAFLTSPVNCAGGSAVTRTQLRVDSWQYFGEFHNYQASPPPVTGCNKLSFRPSLTVTPDTTKVDSPTGLTIDIKLPWSNEPGKLITRAKEHHPNIPTRPRDIPNRSRRSTGLHRRTIR